MKKTLSGFIAVCLVLSLFTGVFVSMPSAKAAIEGDFTYDIVGTAPNQTATITKYAGAGGNIVIPSTLGEYPVTALGNSAFQSCAGLTGVTIGNGVTSIGILAFEQCSSLTSVTIPDSVTSIGDLAFNGCSSLTSITVGPANGSYSSTDGVLFNKTKTMLLACPSGKQGKYVIPNTVTSIGGSAFTGCSSLTSVTIPNSVTSIGQGAFEFCSSLTSVTIPESVTSIGDQAFYKCTSLTSFTIGSGVMSIGVQAFQECKFLTSVIVPNSVTKIGDSAFSGCSSLTSVTIGNGVTSIGEGAFFVCSSLTGITIPNSVTSIGSQAFAYCWKLTAAYFLGNAPIGTTGMFDFCASGFMVRYVSGTTGWSNPWYGYPTVAFMPGAHTLTITASPLAGGTITKSPDQTSHPFGTVVTLTATANSGYTFRSWTGATPVTDHPDQATVTMDADKTVTAIFTDNTGDFQYIIAGGNATITKYTGAGGAVVIPATLGGYPVTSIGDEAFVDCTGLTSITIPNSVTSIGDRAFFGCTGLTSITIPNSVTSIGDRAFFGCTGLTSITIPNSVTSIGGGVFGSCSSMTSITVDPANGSYSSSDGVLFNKTATLLMQCPGGKQGAYVIPNGVTSIGIEAFVGCRGLTSITIPNSVTSIGNDAFGDCSKLTSITVDPANGSYSSSDGVLFNKTAMLLIRCPGGKQGAYVIPNSVTSIGNAAFFDCSSLTSVTIGNGVTSMGIEAFYGCSSLTGVTIPSSVTGIGLNAFWGCSSLTSVTIPSSVTSIGNWAFGWCSSLTSVTIPNSVTSIGSHAFNGCSRLTAAYFLGNAPTGTSDMFDSCASGFTVYYVSGTTGWSNPWYGYPTATFVPVTHTLTTTASPLAGGTITRSPDTASYVAGTVVTVTAVPAAGYTFSSWTGANPVTGHPEQATVTMDADKTISATFSKIPEKVIVLQIGKSTFTVDGNSQTLDSPPVIKNGRTLVPIRAIIEALGGNVGWDATARKATVTLGDKSIALWIGKSAATVNGVSKPIDTADTRVVPEIISGRTMLPLRFVTESLGATLGWDQNTQTITITYQS